MGLKLGCVAVFFYPGYCPSVPRRLYFRGGYVFLPYQLESARAANFNFRQWFPGVIFSCDFGDPLDAVFEDLILPSDVSPVISPVLCQVFLGP